MEKYPFNQLHTGYATIKNINTINKHKSKIARNRVFDCHLWPNWRQMAIKNTVSSNFLSAFVGCKELFRLPHSQCELERVKTLGSKTMAVYNITFIHTLEKSASLNNRAHTLTLYILIDFPIQLKAIRMRLSIIYSKGSHRSVFLNNDEFLSPRIVFTFTNSIDPDEMLHYVLSGYQLRGFQYISG